MFENLYAILQRFFKHLCSFFIVMNKLKIFKGYIQHIFAFFCFLYLKKSTFVLKLGKMFFISFEKLFSFLRYSNFKGIVH